MSDKFFSVSVRVALNKSVCRWVGKAAKIVLNCSPKLSSRSRSASSITWIMVTIQVQNNVANSHKFIRFTVWPAFGNVLIMFIQKSKQLSNKNYQVLIASCKGTNQKPYFFKAKVGARFQVVDKSSGRGDDDVRFTGKLDTLFDHVCIVLKLLAECSLWQSINN